MCSKVLFPSFYLLCTTGDIRFLDLFCHSETCCRCVHCLSLLLVVCQLELRILAHLAKCRSMKEAFIAGGDFHSRTAMNMYTHVREAVENGRVLLEWKGEDKPPVPLLKVCFLFCCPIIVVWCSAWESIEAFCCKDLLTYAGVKTSL